MTRQLDVCHCFLFTFTDESDSIRPTGNRRRRSHLQYDYQCDCTVPAGDKVLFPSGAQLVLLHVTERAERQRHRWESQTHICMHVHLYFTCKNICPQKPIHLLQLHTQLHILKFQCSDGHNEVTFPIPLTYFQQSD